jgi:hypothetical protein
MSASFRPKTAPATQAKPNIRRISKKSLAHSQLAQ